MIQVDNLSFSYPDRRVLKDISFTLEEGKVLSILGPNGVGKTTLLKILSGLNRNFTGSVSSIKEIAYVPQIFSSTVNYTVFNMVLMGRASHVSLFSSPGKEDREKACSALEKAGIEDISGRNFSDISGGEKQLVIIARALASGADVLLLDEPTSDLDLKNQGQVLKLIKELSGKYRFSVIFSTHDPSHALAVSDQVLFLGKNGKSLSGPTEDVLISGNVSDYYSTSVEIVEIKRNNKFYKYCLPIYDV